MDQELLLNRYRLQQRRGRGGFGAVDIAWDQRLRRRVAIKRIPLRVEADDLPGIEEARTAALLSDAHIVSVYDFELTGTEALIIMENVDGPTLAELMQASQDLLDLDTISSILGSIVAALECAHENQVLHLDIKPANVLIDHAGRVKMSDFGLAALSSTMGFAEPQGGTIGYMPPEQIAMEDVDERSDLWALASLTYQLLTGENPFFAHTTQDSLDLIVNEPILLPSALRPELDESLDELLVCALDADKDSRPPSVGAFWKKLSPFLGQQKAGRQRLKALVEQWDAYGKVMVFDPKGARSSLLKAADSESEDREGKILRFGSGPGILWPTRTTKPLPWTLNPEPDFPRAYRNTDYGSTNYSETSYGDANYGEAGYREAGYDNDAVDDNYDSEPYDEEEAEPVPLWYRLSPRLRGVSARLLAALGCASMCWLGASGFEVFISALELSLTIRVVLTLVIALCGFFAPSLGVALASIVLGVGIIIAGQPVAGALVLVGLIVWWILCGRRSPLDATIMALTPLAAALGVPFVIALLAGYFLKLKRALGLSLTAGLLLAILSVLAPPLLLNADSSVFSASDLLRCGFELQISSAGNGLMDAIVAAFSRLDCIIALVAWLLATMVMSLACSRYSRVLWFLGGFVAIIVIAAGVLVAPLMMEPLPLPAVSGFLSLLGTIVSLVASYLIVLIMTSVGIEPQPERQEVEETEQEGE